MRAFCSSLKRQYTTTKLHGATPQKTPNFMQRMVKLYKQLIMTNGEESSRGLFKVLSDIFLSTVSVSRSNPEARAQTGGQTNYSTEFGFYIFIYTNPTDTFYR
jgi:hypothetical protein